MKFTLSWLKDHLDTNAPLDDIAETMINIGLEVEDVSDPAKKFDGFVVAQVIEAKQHPDADRLSICQVNTGSETVEVVCGAPNARTGMKGVFAPVGTYIPGSDFTLTKTKIRGVQSNGMLCSERELEISDQHDGIIELPADAEVGSPAAIVLGLSDPVIDMEVTPNRPDTLAVAGIARDLAAAGMGTLKTPDVDPIKGTFPSPVDIGLKFDQETAHACPIFAGRVVRDLKNGPSPDWLQHRLRAIGLRPVNALVDITNFVSYDRARPLHVYDAAKLKGQIHARLGQKGEKLLALDGNEYDIDDDMCVIADESGVIGLGGVMGGDSTSSRDDTTDVFIESAYFDPLRTARTGRRTGIESDARYRFERGVDPNFVIPGLELATKLILELCGGKASELFIAGAAPVPDIRIDFDPLEVKRLTGLDLTSHTIATILTDLGFACKKGGKGLLVNVPTWRPDVEGPACLVEEIARIHGFDRLPVTPMKRPYAVARPVLTAAQERVRLARRILAEKGLTEAVTWSFITRSHAVLFGGGHETLQLSNPISSELDAMRPSLLPGLINAVGRNVDRGLSDLSLYEVGPQYAGAEPDDQSTYASGITCGAREGAGSARHWSNGVPAADVFDAKSDALSVLAACGIAANNVQIATEAPAWYHPGRSGVIRQGPNNVLAAFGEIHPRVLDKLDVAGPLVGFEVNLDALPLPRAKTSKTKPALNASDLPPVERDFAFVVDRDVTAGALIHAARSAEKKLITNVSLFDVFEGKAIGEGKKSLAVAVTLQPRDKTMTDAEIDAVSAKIVTAVEKATGGTLRA